MKEIGPFPTNKINNSHAGVNLVSGLINAIKPAIEDTAPKNPTVPGDKRVYPSAVKGMKKSQQFFNVSTNTSGLSFTQASARTPTLKTSFKFLQPSLVRILCPSDFKI